MSLPHPSLTGIPPETLDEICKNLDYKEILHLRPVCRHLKNFVDTYRPDFGNKFIVVRVNINEFMVHFGRKGDEFEPTNDSKKVISVVGDENEWGPLETVLAHQKSKLLVFRLCSEWQENEIDFVRLLDKIRTILAAQIRQLQVKSFVTYARNEDDLMRILPYLDPNDLKWIILRNRIPSRPRFHKIPLEILKIKETDQWKSATKFVANDYLMNANLDDFDHFNSFEIAIDTLRMSYVRMFKEKLFASRIQKSATIEFRNLVKDAEIPEGRLPILNDGYVHKYPIPNTNKHVKLRLSNTTFHIGVYETPRVVVGVVDLSSDSDDE